jgi:segregation and condensation protein B
MHVLSNRLAIETPANRSERLFPAGLRGEKPAIQARIHFWKSSPQTPSSPKKDSGSPNRGRIRRMRDLEAALFLSREPMSGRRLAKLAGVDDLSETRTLIELLNRYYDAVGRAFRVESVAGGYLLMTRPELSAWLRRLVPRTEQVRLSTPAMETLVVVAYRQPVVRAEIDAIRGVNCGEILRQLMETDMVRISGRSEDLGRPYLYSTTNRFLKHFGLNNLDELPKTKKEFTNTDNASRDPEAVQTNDPLPSDSLKNLEEKKVSITASSSIALTLIEEVTTPLLESSQPVNIDVDDDYDYDEDDDDDDEDDDYEEDDIDDDEEDDDEDDDFVDDDDIDDDDDVDDVEDEVFDDEDDEWEEVEDDDDELDDDDDDLDDDDDDDWEDDDDEDDDDWD